MQTGEGVVVFILGVQLAAAQFPGAPLFDLRQFQRGFGTGKTARRPGSPRLHTWPGLFVR